MRQRVYSLPRLLKALGLMLPLLLLLAGLLLITLPAYTTWRALKPVGLPSAPFGRVQALTGGGPGQPLFAGTINDFDAVLTTGAVYRSDDGGASWYSSSVGLSEQPVALLIGGTAGHPLFAATEAYPSGSSQVYRSDDGGRSWNRIGKGFTMPVDALLDGAEGHPLFAMSGDTRTGPALYRMDAGSTSWSPVTVDDRVNQVYWVVGEPPNTPLVVMTDRGVYRSSDEGLTWLQVNTMLAGNRTLGLVGGGPGQPIIAIMRDLSDSPYLLISRDSGTSWQPQPQLEQMILRQDYTLHVRGMNGGQDGLPLYLQTFGGPLRSDNGGIDWQRTSSGGDLILASTPDLAGGGVGQPLFAALSDTIFRSDDGGATWRNTSTWLSGSAVAGLIGGENGGPLFAGTIEGRAHGTSSGAVYRSDDRGHTWFPVEIGAMSGGVYHMYGGRYGAPLFVVTAFQLWRSDDDGKTWAISEHSLFPDDALVVAGGTDGQPLFAGTRSGLLRSDDGGESWQQVNLGEVTTEIYGLSVGKPGEPLFAAGSYLLYRSDDGGRSWVRTEACPESCNITALAGGQGGQPLLMGTETTAGARGRSRVYHSDDGGRSWSDASTGLDTDGCGVQSIVAGLPGQPLYVSTCGGVRSGLGRVYRSDDGGRTWFNVSGWPLTVTIQNLVIAPDARTLLAATDQQQVFRSTDGGEHWLLAPDLAAVTLARGADTSPLTLTLRDGQIRIQHRAYGWTYSASSPLSVDSLAAIDYAIVSDHVMLVAVDRAGQIQRAEIQLPLLWLPDTLQRWAGAIRSHS